MKEKLLLVKVDSEYCNYLGRYDEKVSYNFREKELRPFIGVLFEVESCKYFAPLSSPKPKFLQMKNKIDFLRIDNGKLGAINFNNMIPVKLENIVVIDLKKECITKAESKYQNLLRDQLTWLNRNDEKLYSRASKLYKRYVNNMLSSNIKDRCCNFKLLESKCSEFNNSKYNG